MLTRCPQCETIFRVSKKHISAAKGLVRCGSCKDIFNAKEHVIKSKKDLKKPTAAIKPEAQITKSTKVKEAIVAERKQTITNNDVALEENSFDFVKDGFISTGAYRKFDTATPTPKPPINKKPTSKAQALDQGKPINFDSVFEDDAPKIPTKDVFIVKKPTVTKKPDTDKSSQAISTPKPKTIQATFKAKTIQPHKATNVTIAESESEKKSSKAGKFITQNVIEIKNVFNSISKKITAKVANKIQQEKSSDEIVKKSLENKLNKSKLATKATTAITETKISTPIPTTKKVAKKPAVMSITSETDIFSTSKISTAKTQIENKVKETTKPKPAENKVKEQISENSEPKIKQKPKLNEDAALKLAIQLKKAAQEKSLSTNNKKLKTKSSQKPKTELQSKAVPNDKETNKKPEVDITKPIQPSKPELNIIDSSSTNKPETKKDDDKPIPKQETEPKLQLLETKDKDKPEDKKPLANEKKDAELIAKENPDSDTEEDEKIEGTDVHIHMQTTDIPMVLRESLEELDLPSRSPEMTIFMIFSLILLCAGLLLQFAVFRSIEVQQSYPALKPLITKVCKIFTCDYNGPREIKKIQLISRDIRVHPNTKGALLISATIINNANYQQPYPNFSVKLSNLSGKTTAVRYFSPNDYLGKLSNKLLLMPPKQPIRIALEVVDPGKDAINFEFKFLARK